MNLSIKYKEAIENKSDEQIIISFGKKQIICSKQTDEWNSEKINAFLIDLASATPDDEKIEIEYDENNKADNYRHIVELFSSFVEEFNKK